MTKSKQLITSLLAIFFAFALAACDGPAEDAGEDVDEAMENTEDTMEETMENTEETIEETGDAIEEQTDQN
jgi:predicted small secreted protein